MTKKVVIKTFNDLVKVFPNMTLSQIISIYKQVQRSIKNIVAMLEDCKSLCEYERLIGELDECLKADTFLGTYLAKCFCKQNGF